MSDMNMPGERDGVMGDEPSIADHLAEEHGGDVTELAPDDDAKGLGRTPMPPD